MMASSRFSRLTIAGAMSPRVFAARGVDMQISIDGAERLLTVTFLASRPASPSRIGA